MVDGKDVRDYNFFQLCCVVGYVFQDVFLFFDIIVYNIVFGKWDVSWEEVEEYVCYVVVYDDIMELFNGFDIFVGERGVIFFGGQK